MSDPSEGQQIAEMLERILARDVVLISKDAEGEYLGNAGRKASAASSLLGCIEGMTDHPRTKICLRDDCKSRGRPQPLWAFSKDSDAKDRHQAVCKKCEAKRIGNLTKKRKKAKNSERGDGACGKPSAPDASNSPG